MPADYEEEMFRANARYVRILHFVLKKSIDTHHIFVILFVFHILSLKIAVAMSN